MYLKNTWIGAVHCSCHAPFARHNDIRIEGMKGWYLNIGASAPHLSPVSSQPWIPFTNFPPPPSRRNHRCLAFNRRPQSCFSESIRKTTADSPLLTILTLSNNFLPFPPPLSNRTATRHDTTSIRMFANNMVPAWPSVPPAPGTQAAAAYQTTYQSASSDLCFLPNAWNHLLTCPLSRQLPHSPQCKSARALANPTPHPSPCIPQLPTAVLTPTSHPKLISQP